MPRGGGGDGQVWKVAVAAVVDEEVGLLMLKMLEAEKTENDM